MHICDLHSFGGSHKYQKRTLDTLGLYKLRMTVRCSIWMGEASLCPLEETQEYLTTEPSLQRP